jgi:hypothetical protein
LCDSERSEQNTNCDDSKFQSFLLRELTSALMLLALLVIAEAPPKKPEHLASWCPADSCVRSLSGHLKTGQRE